MEFIFKPGSIFFNIPYIIQLASLLFIFNKNQKKMLLFSNTALTVGLVLSLFTLMGSSLFGFSSFLDNKPYWNFLRFDNLSLYFLIVIQFVAIAVNIYNFSYLKEYINKGRQIKSVFIFYVILLISTQMLVVVNHSILFLIVWEVMSLSGYFAMLLEKEKTEVQKGSFYYFAASHVIVFLLYIMFFLLKNATGSWFFNDFYINDYYLQIIIFSLAFIAFGIKAGFMPFHFWLPQAHPIAPSFLSAFLSGVIIKLGIYGIIRTFLFLEKLPEFIAWVVIVISLYSAIMGVWYALAQHDIKRLLAYHSVENIGIIGLGIGLGLLGSSYNNPAIEVLGFGGALLHTLNHAIFKSLLFLGSGTIYSNLKTRNIELMGGLVHKAKYLAVMFLIGSVAISGLPPFNGFISEFIIYSGLFKSAEELQKSYYIIMLVLVVGLAFVGGLAVACFTKVNSIIFLGAPKTNVNKFILTKFEKVAFALLAFVCIFVGIFPYPVVGIVNNVIINVFRLQYNANNLVSINWVYYTSVFFSLALIIFIVYFLKLKNELKYGYRVSDAWGCGYTKLNNRMQYTASSFADELISIPNNLLMYEKHVKVSNTPFPVKSNFSSHSKDFIDNKIVLPFYKFIEKLSFKIKIFSLIDIRYYITSIIITLIIYSLIAFLWT